VKHIQQTVIQGLGCKYGSPNIIPAQLNNTERSVARIRIRTILDLKVRPESTDFLDDVGDIIFNMDEFSVH
jgi:hypothetical protein